MGGRRRRVLAALTAVLAPLSVSACAAVGPVPGRLSVVASTNVYAAIAAALAAGTPVQVTALIADPATDPHTYEATPRNELAVARANLVIENGGGYDDFVGLLRAASHSRAKVIDAVDVSGKPQGADLNEHVWYDFPTVAEVAARVSEFLIAHDRRDATVLRANARAFERTLRSLEADEARIRAAHDGQGVAITEALPLYLLQACGLVNRTPRAFSNSVEDGVDVSPRVLQTTLDLFTAHRVRLLVYNAQTQGGQADQVIAAARSNGVPVVPVTETLPAGLSYAGWMRGILHHVVAALR